MSQDNEEGKARIGLGRNQNMPPQNMYLWCKDYFELTILENARHRRSPVLQPVKTWQVHSGFGQTEENAWSLTCLYSRVGDPACVLQAACVQSEAPTPFYATFNHSWQKARILHNTAWFRACKPAQGYGNSLSDRVSKLWEHYLSGPFSRLWETASLGCPDIWVRKPDCLCLPYKL